LSPTKTRPHHLSPAVLLGVVSTVLALVLFGQIPGEGRWVAELGNSVHGPAFAVVTLILIVLLRRRQERRATVLGDYSVALAAGVLLGALVEVLQFATGRDASFDDLLRDTLGAVAALGFFSVRDSRVGLLPRCNAIRWTGVLAAVVSAAIIVAPIVVTGAAYLQRNRTFPTLVDFQSPLSTFFLAVSTAVTVERTALPFTASGGESGTNALRVLLAGDKRWALFLQEPRPDWRGYERVGLDVMNPTEVPLRIAVRIWDTHPHSDRRDGDIGSIEVAPGSRATVTVALPQASTAAREPQVDLATIRKFVLKQDRANQAREFYLVRVWLE